MTKRRKKHILRIANYKYCGLCKTEKPKSEFWKEKANKDGLGYRCKPCCLSIWLVGYKKLRLKDKYKKSNKC